MPILILVDVQVIFFAGMSVGELLNKRTLPWTCVLLCFSVIQLKKTPNTTVQLFSESAAAVCRLSKKGARAEIAPLSV